MENKDYISFMIFFILCLLASAFKLWDYFLVRQAVKAERTQEETPKGDIVIKPDWRAALSALLLFLGALVPLLSGSISAVAPLILFVVFAAAALYYMLHNLLWRVTVGEDSFTYHALTGKETTYRFESVHRVVSLGKNKRKMDGARIVLRGKGSVYIDRTLYGLETLERRILKVQERIAAETERLEAEAHEGAQA